MAKQPKPIDVTLKAAIKASGLTHYALAKVTGITAGQLDRFMSGERDLRLASAAAVAAALGLELRTV
jgi:transcriptional regulator with XRE-family HTH domain